VNELAVYDLWRGALTTAVTVAAPFVVSALTVGLIMSIVQAATQLQENVLTFVPKLAALAVLLTLAGPWSLQQLVAYTERAAETVVELGRSAPQ
jgi:flagellar biosynthetic protein FliQ